MPITFRGKAKCGTLNAGKGSTITFLNKSECKVVNDSGGQIEFRDSSQVQVVNAGQVQATQQPNQVVSNADCNNAIGGKATVGRFIMVSGHGTIGDQASVGEAASIDENTVLYEHVWVKPFEGKCDMGNPNSPSTELALASMEAAMLNKVSPCRFL